LITIDTSGLFELLNRRGPEHHAVREVLESDPGPFIVPVPILAEIAYMIEQRLGQRVMDDFLGDLADGAYSLDCGLDDIPLVRALVNRYADLPLGLADASVVACAERNEGRVLSLDRRDFSIVARDRRITLLPATG
jgi:predicted nucleic acid-binding protein